MDTEGLCYYLPRNFLPSLVPNDDREDKNPFHILNGSSYRIIVDYNILIGYFYRPPNDGKSYYG